MKLHDTQVWKSIPVLRIMRWTSFAPGFPNVEQTGPDLTDPIYQDGVLCTPAYFSMSNPVSILPTTSLWFQACFLRPNQICCPCNLQEGTQYLSSIISMALTQIPVRSTQFGLSLATISPSFFLLLQGIRAALVDARAPIFTTPFC